MASTQNTTSTRYVTPTQSNQDKLVNYLAITVINNHLVIDDNGAWKHVAAAFIEHEFPCQEKHIHSFINKKLLVKIRKRIQNLRKQLTHPTPEKTTSHPKRSPIHPGNHPGELSPQYLHRMNYAEYLQTSHWREMRLRKLAQASNRCQLCNTLSNLEVHRRQIKEKRFLSSYQICCAANIGLRKRYAERVQKRLKFVRGWRRINRNGDGNTTLTSTRKLGIFSGR